MQLPVIQALSADSLFLAALSTSGGDFRIHSCFNQVVNLVCLQSHQLYTLAGCKLDNAPHTLRVALDGWHEFPLLPEMEAAGFPHRLQLGQVVNIDISACQLWSPPEITYRASQHYPADYFQRVCREIVDQISAEEKCAAFYYQGDNIFYQTLRRLLNEASDRLISGLKNDCSATITHGLQSLLGLGTGLTPSGDDFILGLCALLTLAEHPGQRYLPLFAEVISGDMPGTNLISQMAMQQAVQGRVRESISALLEAIFSGSLASVRERMKPVLAIGSSSGADILSGIAAGLQLSTYLERCYANQGFD